MQFINKLFITLAALLTSGIFGYSYLSQWVRHTFYALPIDLQPNPEVRYPYYHQTETLYLNNLLIFGGVFLLIFIMVLYFALRQQWKSVFWAFVNSMLVILAVMINGAIK